MPQPTPVEACSEFGYCLRDCINAPAYCQRELDGTVAQCPSPLVQQPQPAGEDEAGRLA